MRVDAHGVHRGISSDPQDASSQLDGKPWRSDLASSSEEGFSSLNAVGSGESVSSDGALKRPAETDSHGNGALQIIAAVIAVGFSGSL